MISLAEVKGGVLLSNPPSAIVQLNTVCGLEIGFDVGGGGSKAYAM